MPLPRSIAWLLVALSPLGCDAAATGPSAPPSAQHEHRDPGRGFAFSYPADYGTVAPGTNDGFGNRAAALRFSVFSHGGVGGEAVLTQGPPSLDVQAAGGLYDAIAREALPASLDSVVADLLPRLTAANLCDQLAVERHLDVSAGALASLPQPHRDALAALDRTGSVDPVIVRCTVTGDVVTFDKEAAVTPGGPRRRVYGAVRFLDGRYSAFQLIRAGGAPTPDTITGMQSVVASWRVIP